MEQYIGTKIVRAGKAQRGDCVSDTSEFSALQLAEKGYRVGYSDGYVSWSPKDVFERSYRRTDSMTFGLALEALQMNHRVTRSGWNGKSMWLRIVIPGGDNKTYDIGMENLPYIEIKTRDDKLAPWTPSQCDVLADDWIIVN